MNHKLNKPIQYQQGSVEFYKLKFTVTPDVLIPRPETELLVDEVLSLSSSNLIGGSINSDNLVVVDVGTGSGNIAIAIAKNLPASPLRREASRQGLPKVKVIATDISQKVLKVAKHNARFHHVQDRILFLQGDLLRALDNDQYDRLVYHTDRNPDLLVANLPYIPSERIPYLDPSVKDFEPRVALDGGEDGFELYRKLFQQISRQPRRLQPKFTICEIDYTHGELAVQEALKYFPKAEVEVKKDLARLQRMLIIRFPEG